MPESHICSLLFSKCSAKKTATSRTDSPVLATISEFPRTCPHLFHSLPRTPFLDYFRVANKQLVFQAFTSSGPRTSTPCSRGRNRISAIGCCAPSTSRFQLLFPNQVIRADDLARAMVNVAIRGTERGCLVFETVTSAPWSKLLLENRRRAADPLPL